MRIHASYYSAFLDVLTHLCAELRPRTLPELTIPQINMLNLMDLVQPVHPSDLARVRGVSRASISESIRRLSALGLVERRRSDRDRRFIEIRLTPEGDRLRRLPSSIDPQRADELVARLTAEFRYGARRALEILEAGLDAACGRDFVGEERMRRRDLRRAPRVWLRAAAPPEDEDGRGPGRPPVRLGRHPPDDG